MTYRILSIDGGGIAGLFVCTLLDRLIDEHAFPQLIEQTDLLAGTSTGGIIALGLAAHKSPAELGKLYHDHASELFAESLVDDIARLGNALGAAYSGEPLHALLKATFGEVRLGDLAPENAGKDGEAGGKRVLVPSFDLSSPPDPARGRPAWAWKPKFFHNFPPDADEPNDDLSDTIVDIALRTSAAPTYFPSYQGYIDGGVVANNPAMCAIAQALHARAQGQGPRLESLRVLSLGTGFTAQKINHDTVDWGWAQWAKPLISIMLGGSAGVVDYQCRQLLGNRYLRVDPLFDRNAALDDKRPATLRYLIEQAHSIDLAPIIAWLENNWSD